MFRKLILVGLFILSPFIYAAGGSSGIGEITVITIYEGHTGILINHTNQIDPDTCGRRDFFILPNTHPYFKEAYSMLLAVNMAGKKVSLNIQGCHEGIPVIRHIVTAK